MKKEHILFLEDNPHDAELNERALRREGIDFRSLRVETEHDFEEALQSFKPDLILADYSMPAFNGIKALAMTRERDKDLPFIFVSGVMGEERALKSLQEGANDYILKDRLSRLPVAVKRALEENRKRKQLAISERRYRELVDNMVEGVAVYGAVDEGENFVFRELNQAGEEVTGLTRGQAIGRLVTDVFPGVVEIGLLDVFRRVYQTGIPESLPATKYMDQRISLWVENSVFKLASGEIVAVYNNVSDRKELEAQVLVTEKMATIAGLAAGVAHEINTPLSGILQSAQLVSQSFAAESKRNREIAAKCGVDLNSLQRYLQEQDLFFFLDGMRESAKKASRIVAGLLQFSRPNDGAVSQVQLNDLVESSIELTRADYSLKKELNVLDVVFVQNFGELPEIECVAMEIEQVVINLLKNSCQALVGHEKDNPPCITLQTKYENDEVVFAVTDNGKGMAPDVCNHAFDPFYTTKGVGEGTGLGLAVSYSIICDKHGGTIRVESTPGKGTCVTISLPVKNPGLWTGKQQSSINDLGKCIGGLEENGHH